MMHIKKKSLAVILGHRKSKYKLTKFLSELGGEG